MTGFDFEERLRDQGRRADSDIDLAEAALLAAAMDREACDLTPYRARLADLAAAVAKKIPPDAQVNAAGQGALLRDVLAGEYGYAGDTLTYDDPQNANLLRVIDRRKGLPVALAIIYIHTARQQGWMADGINFPGHFLIRLEAGSGRVILDPFNGGLERSVADLRGLVKQMEGLDAELTPDHYSETGNRAILIRLLNNIKLRAITAGEVRRAAEIIDRMQMIAPDDLTLMREAGMCHGQLGNLRRATESLEGFLARAGDPGARQEVEAMLREFRKQLN